MNATLKPKAPPPCVNRDYGEGNSPPMAKFDLEILKGYHHEGVVGKYQTELKLSRQEALQLFGDVKGFLYICAVTKAQARVPAAIDPGWHEFLMFTKDYAAFCYQMFGHFVHHQPIAVGTKVAGLIEVNGLAEASFGMLSTNWALSAEDPCCPDHDSADPPGNGDDK